MRIPKGKRWLTILVVAFTLMFVTGAAYAISPGTLGVVATIAVRVETDSEEEVIFLPGVPVLPGLTGDGQALGEENYLYGEDDPGHVYDENDDYDYGHGYDENDKDGYCEDENGNGNEGGEKEDEDYSEDEDGEDEGSEDFND